jgi:hypothetical protein
MQDLILPLATTAPATAMYGQGVSIAADVGTNTEPGDVVVYLGISKLGAQRAATQQQWEHCICSRGPYTSHHYIMRQDA